MSRARGWTASDPFTDTYADAYLTPVHDPAEDEPDAWRDYPPTNRWSNAQVLAACAAGDVAAQWEAAYRGLPEDAAA